MTAIGTWRFPTVGSCLVAGAFLITDAAVDPLTLLAQEGTSAGCQLCHGELEFLRQRVTTLQDARQLHVPTDALAQSAHGPQECQECHGGYGEYPHATTGSTESCASCHEEAETAWLVGVHAIDDAADCVPCHGVHDVPALDPDSENGSVAHTQALCISCHAASVIPNSAPHADSVTCFDCHASHEQYPVEEVQSLVSPIAQIETCGACHEEIRLEWPQDSHGATTMLGDAAWIEPQEAPEHPPPSCITCHGSHPTTVAEGGDFLILVSPTCAECHEEYGESFAHSYHGQASELGSEDAATCASCHTAHSILPTSDSLSSVAPGNLYDTCAECHDDAGANFVGFQPHANYYDVEKYPYVVWTYRLMTTLLVSVFVLFGIHTALWMIRLTLDHLHGIRLIEGTPDQRDP